MRRVDLLEKTLMLGGIGGQEKGTTEDEMAGWHHRLHAHKFGWTPGVSDGQGGLECSDSWGHKESDTTKQLNWTDTWWMSPALKWQSNSNVGYLYFFSGIGNIVKAHYKTWMCKSTFAINWEWTHLVFWIDANSKWLPRTYIATSRGSCQQANVNQIIPLSDFPVLLE